MQTDNIQSGNHSPMDLSEQINIIEQSQWYILILAAATLLSYCTTEMQKQTLLCSCVAPDSPVCDLSLDPYSLQLTSSAMIIGALIYFYQLSAAALTQPKETPLQCASSRRNYLSNSLVLAAALIRLYDLQENHNAAVAQNPTFIDLEPPL